MATINPYEKQSWDPGTPITQDRMNHIEEGIFAKSSEINNVNTELASLQADYSTTKSNLSQDLTSKVDASTVTDMINTAIGQTAINDINNNTGTYGVGGNIDGSSTPAKAGDIIKQLAVKVQTAGSGSTKGATAFDQLVTAGALTNNGSIVGDGLIGLFTEIRNAIGYNSETGNLAFNKTNPINLAVSTASKNASDALRAIGEINALGQGYTDNNLAGRLYDYGKKLETLEQAATQVGGEGATLAGLLSSFRTEITNARTSSIVRYTDPSTGTIGDKTFDSVDSRLENIEELILGNSNKNPVVVGLSEKVSNLAPINSLTSSSTTQPLAAAQGPAITNLISAAETAAIDYADNYKVAQADIIQDYGANLTTAELSKKVLSGTVGKNIDTRITNITTEIGNAHRTTSDTLAARFEAIETGASTTRGDVDKIITELAMTNQAGAIQDTNTRIDTIEKNVLEMGKEIGMISDKENVTALSDTVVRDATRIDTLTQEINDAHISTAVKGANGENRDFGTLDARFEDLETRAGTLESNLNTADTGLKAKVTTLEAKTATLEGTTATGAVKYGDILNSLENSSDEHKPLDSRQGYALNRRINTLESTVGDSLSNTGLVKAVSTLSGQVGTISDSLGSYATTKNAIANAFNDINSKIGNGFDTTTNTVTKAVTDINAKIGGNYDSTNTVAADITTKTNAVKTYTDEKITATTTAYTEADATNLQAAKDYTDEKAEEITTAYETADTALGGRLNTVEGILNDAKASTVADTTYDSLDARLEAIESHAATADTTASGLRQDVNKIANELSMLDNDTITDVGTRIDNITDEINAAHRQLVDENEEPIADSLDKRFDDIEARANTLEGQNLNTRVTTLESTVNHETTGLVATKAIADANKTAIGDENSGLMGRVHTLETQPKSATTIIEKERIVYDGNGVPTVYTAAYSEQGTNIPITPSNEVDYLFETEVGSEIKYFYWKYIDNKWELISGGGGSSTGSSSGEFAASLEAIENPDPNIDYFVGNGTDGYTHYRYVQSTQENGTGTFVRILPNNLIGDISVDEYGGLIAHTIEDNQTNLLSNFYALKGVTYTPNYDPEDPETLISQTLQFTGTNGETIDPIVIVGGGGGSGTVYSVNIESPTPASRSIPMSNTDPVTITAKVVMKQGSELLGSGATATGQIQYRRQGSTVWQNGDPIEVEAVDPALKYIIQNNVNFTVDVSKYLIDNGTVQIRLAIIATPGGEGTEVTRYQTFYISKVNIAIAAEGFDYASVKNSNFQFNYRCYGTGISKTVHFLVDNVDVVTPVSVPANVTNTTVLQQIIPMTGKINGMHTFQVYFVTNTGIESNKLNYFILYNTDTSRQAPLIGAAAENTNIIDGDEIVVNYSVNTIGTETTDKVEIELYTLDENNNKQVKSITTLTNVPNNVLASPPYRTFDYPSLKKVNPNDPDPAPITVYVQLTATHNIQDENSETISLTDSQTVSVEVRYLNTTYNLEPETNNLLFDYNAYGRSNNDVGKEKYTYKYTKTSGDNVLFTGTFNKFNWATDGYVDGESLIIGGGATLSIDVPIFNSTFNDVNIEENENVDKITTNGRTIELDYEVLSTTNLSATIIDCMTNEATPRGFRVTPQNCYLLNSGSKIDIDETGFIKNEENVAAAYLNPGERTHLTFVIEPISTELAADNTYHQSVNIYINGEFANACPYNVEGADFTNGSTIVIGSDTCLIKLYSIKLYNRGLTEAKVLHNYAVAPVATRDKLNRLAENDILNEQGKVDYEKARRKYTCLLLTGMGTVNGVAVPTMAPYKGYPSVVGRQKDGDTVGKTESGLLLTKPTTENSDGYTVEFNLQDRMIDPNGLYGYASSNNVQGTSSQKFPVKNLKVYLAKGDDSNVIAFDESQEQLGKKVYKYSINIAAESAYRSIYGNEVELPEYITSCGDNVATIVKNLEEIPTQEQVIEKIREYLTTQDENVGAAYSTYSTGDELITHPILGYKKSKKVKYALRENGIGESTLCWKADYMSTDHANTFNANIANTLYSAEDRLSSRWTDQTQFTVYGIKCLLFQQNGADQPEFVGDGCLNNDKGNNKTFGLEAEDDDEDNTMCQKWDFRNNTGSLLYFKHDGLFEIIDGKPAVARELECIYPDEGDLADIGKVPNYNHFQILSSWLGNRANYWYESDAELRANKKEIFINEFTNHFNLNHILIYYLFMEYTALCDNRVKNIHMRTDNAGLEVVRDKEGNILLDGNNNPNSGPWTLAENLETRVMREPVMDENGDYQFDQDGNMQMGNVSHVFVTNDVINNIDWQQGENHSNFAIWAPVLYDLDSCFSADNVGYLKIRYDADWNYSLYNKLKFAGFDSILWLQVEDCFQDELKAMAKKLYNQVVGLNYSTFYRNQITDNLASLCPAITNQDMILKYEKPWTEGFLDYSQDVLHPKTSTDKYKYLQRGTRTGQKAIFMRQRSLFLASKYDCNEFVQNKITFRAGTQVNHENSVLTITANQKLYPGAQFGDVNDTTKVTRRATKVYDTDTETFIDMNENDWVPEFTPCQIQHSGTMNNTDGIEIYGASVLNDIGDISRFHPWQIKLGSAVNLKKLILGSTAAGYSNTSTDDIDGLNSCVLLEEINVCNLKNLNSLQLGNNGFIKKVYAIGSGLSTIGLPRGGVLDTIAYGENITDITIINQSRLVNFSYENAENNHYANVSRLWIENTSNVPIVDIINNNIQNLNNGIRLIGIDIDLGDDSTFLEKIASDLAVGKYMTASGSCSPGNKQTPTITGTIRISSIRESLYFKLKDRYPNLVINYGERVTENTITYLNYDKKEVLYIDHRINNENVIDPVVDINPVTGKPYYEGFPEKPEDAQYKYKFGTYTKEGAYVKYSGWVELDTTTNPTSTTKVQSNITYIAYYPTKEDQIYKVRWYDGAKELKSVDIKYGLSVSSSTYPSEDGTLIKKGISSDNMYRVFKGWDKPLGKILHDTNVYAQWETSEINGNTSSIDMSALTAADIYALSQLGTDKISSLLSDKLGDPIYVPIGQEFDYSEGMINLKGNNNNNIILNGSADPNTGARVYNNITPLMLNSDWTLAIDYKFNSVEKLDGTEFVLASCYQEANGSVQGFKVSLVKSYGTDQVSHAIQVSWGTTTQTIDYVITTIDSKNNILSFINHRNVVVLSHNAVEPNDLKVTFVMPDLSSQYSGNDPAYGSNTTHITLTYNNLGINKPLILGGNQLGTSSDIEFNTSGRVPAKATIYWAKFWNVDLGESNCRRIASWIHETVPFYLTGFNGTNNSESEQIYENSKLSFVAARGLGDRYIYSDNSYRYTNAQGNVIDTDENGRIGWHISNARKICQNLIYNALPDSYRSIIQPTKVVYISHNPNADVGIGYIETTYDYLFLPAYEEVSTDVSGILAEEIQSSWTGPWSWMVPNSRQIYTIDTTVSTTDYITRNATSSNVFLYRFSTDCITDATRFFQVPNEPSRYKFPSAATNLTCIDGDVWINSTTNIAYMYYSDETIVDRNIKVDIVSTNGGGWKSAEIWNLRTINLDSAISSENTVIRVKATGNVVIPGTRNEDRGVGRLLCPEFTV